LSRHFVAEVLLLGNIAIGLERRSTVMTKQKDLKRVIRTRMQKTGESYTTARLHIVKPDFATIAGTSDAALKKATGCKWDKWVRTLDHRGAQNMKHGDIARLAHEYGAGDWWAQTVAVGYERIRGLRARGQQRSGEWRATKSRTIGVPVATLFKAFRQSLPPGAKVRTATAPKSMRITWEDGTSVAVGFLDKGAKSTVALEHTGLKSKAQADVMKKFWTEHLGSGLHFAVFST